MFEKCVCESPSGTEGFSACRKCGKFVGPVVEKVRKNDLQNALESENFADWLKDSGYNDYWASVKKGL